MSVNRRHFLRTMAAASAVSAAGCSSPIGFSIRETDHSSNIHIIDLANGFYTNRKSPPKNPRLDGLNACTKSDDAFIDNLKAKGVDTVIRYYSDRNNNGMNCKNLTIRERDLLFDHGLSVAMVYQYAGRRYGRYTAKTAIKDAKFILERAKLLRQPEGSAIYIGVDSDTERNSERNVIEYFTALHRAVDGRFDLGIYAPGKRCEAIRKRALAKYFWVPEAPAWEGTNEFMNSGNWTMYQNKTKLRRSELANGDAEDIVLDTDFINPLSGNTIGAFSKDRTVTTYSPKKISLVANSRFWVNVRKANLRSSPGGSVVGHMCTARMVHVLETQADWAKVDIDEDGLAEGYIHKSLLLPFDQKPRWINGSGCIPMKL